jgi:transposase InsO family protein
MGNSSSQRYFRSYAWIRRLYMRTTPYRPSTNGIAERFIKRLKEMLAEGEWRNGEELKMVLDEVIKEYNDTPHQVYPK